MSVLQDFVDAECNAYVRQVLLAELAAARPAYLTFNIFNVRIDPELGVVTVEDELDPCREETVDFAEFRTAIERRAL